MLHIVKRGKNAKSAGGPAIVAPPTCSGPDASFFDGAGDSNWRADQKTLTQDTLSARPGRDCLQIYAD